MSTEVKRRRGTTLEHSSFTGAIGEITIDLDKDTVVVHDGATQGGFSLLREDFSNANWLAPDGRYLLEYNNLSDITSASSARSNLGLGSISTLNSINNNNWSGADLTISNGGTGASSASVARSNLGLEIGVDVQPYNANLTTYASNPLTSSELSQLQNIGSTTISSAQWGYLGVLNQNLRTSDNVTFGAVTSLSSIVVSGTVDGRDISGDGSKLDNLYDTIGLSALTAAEVNQLENIGSTTISSTQWSYLGVLNQNLRTSDNVSFQDVTFNNKALISHTHDSSNIDHIWHDDSVNTWHLVSDAAYKATGNTNLRVGTVNTGQGNNELYAMNQNVRTSDDVTFNNVSPTGTVDGRNISSDGNKLDELYTTIGLSALTSSEVNQLENIGSTTISATQWGYLGVLNQNLRTSDNVTFGAVTSSSNIVVSGTVDGRDVSGDGNKLDQLYDTIGLKDLTTSEVNQLENIGATTISATQWGYLGALNQNLRTSDNVTFNTVNGRNITSDGANLDNLYSTIGLSALTSSEVDQLENIGSTTISSTQWGYLGSMNQNVRTSDNVTFGAITSLSNIVVSGTVDGRDVSGDGNKLDELYTTIGLSDLTSSEVNQLENIGSTTISSTQWGYLGSMNQNVRTSDDVTFGKVTAIPSGTIGGTNLANAGLLVGTTSSGVGIDVNEITSRGGDLYIRAGTTGSKLFLGTGTATSRLVIGDSNGYIGVNESSPAARFHIRHSADEILRLNHSSETGNPYVSFYQGSTRRGFLQYVDSTNRVRLASEYGHISLDTGIGGSESERMRITAGGNVLIGTTTDSGYKLHVHNGTAYITPIAYAANQSAYALKIGAYNNSGFDMGLQIKSTSLGVPYMSFKTTSADDVLTLKSSNVGIGTASPSYKLDVNGNTRIVGTNNDYGLTIVRGNAPSQYLNLRGYQVLSSGNHLLLTSDVSQDVRIGSLGNESNVIVKSNGNFLIGTATDSGYKLDVNGNTRIVGTNNDYGLTIVRGNAPSQYLNLRGYQVLSSGNHLLLTSDVSQDVRIGSLGNESDLVVKSNGNVLIGTTTDSGYKLDVNGDIRISSGTSGDAILKIEADTDNNNESDNPRIEMYQDGGATGAIIGFDESNFGSNRFGIGRRISGTNHYDTFVIRTDNGNVSIGTTTDSGDKLNVNGNTRVSGDINFNNSALVSYKLDDSNIDHIWHDDASEYDSGGTWNFVSDSSYKSQGNALLRAGNIYLKDSGKRNYIAGSLGLGVTDPLYKLDVNGTLRAVSDATFNSNVYVEGGLFAKEFVVNQTKVLFDHAMTVGGGKISTRTGSAGSETITFQDENGSAFVPVAVNDIIHIQQRTGLTSGVIVKSIRRKVASIASNNVTLTTSGISWTTSNDVGSIEVGDHAVVKGNTSNTSRDHYISFDLSATDSPRMLIYDGVTDVTGGNVRGGFGNLAGHYGFSSGTPVYGVAAGDSSKVGNHFYMTPNSSALKIDDFKLETSTVSINSQTSQIQLSDATEGRDVTINASSSFLTPQVRGSETGSFTNVVDWTTALGSQSVMLSETIRDGELIEYEVEFDFTSTDIETQAVVAVYLEFIEEGGATVLNTSTRLIELYDSDSGTNNIKLGGKFTSPYNFVPPSSSYGIKMYFKYFGRLNSEFSLSNIDYLIKVTNRETFINKGGFLARKDAVNYISDSVIKGAYEIDVPIVTSLSWSSLYPYRGQIVKYQVGSNYTGTDFFGNTSTIKAYQILQIDETIS